MANLKLGLVHTPITPFKADRRIDFGLFENVIAFHLANGAEALAIQMHAGERIAANRARFAQDIGAAAVIATTPYYWTPPASMIIEHFARIAAAVTLPFFVFHTPDELAATKLA